MYRYPKPTIHRFYSAMLVGILTMAAAQAGAQQDQQVQELKALKVGKIPNLHQLGDFYFAGQPTKEDFKLLADMGVKAVINLRMPGELDWDEKSVVEGLGMKYYSIPFKAPETLTDKVFDEVRKILREQRGALLVHCSTANRVGAVWIAFRVLDCGVPLDRALKEAKQIGLRTAEYEARVKEYIEKHKTSPR
ncbi:MAG: hypothetical protein C4297_10780 [Gemmataceae bacterium]